MPEIDENEHCDNSWPPLNTDLQEKARNFIVELEEDFPIVLAGYETEDDSIFPKKSFSKSLAKLSPIKYWEYITKISIFEPVKRFSQLHMAIFSCPPSSAGIERVFSTAGLIHTKLRNRLNNNHVAKLVRVCRHLGSKDKTKRDQYEVELISDLDLIEGSEI